MITTGGSAVESAKIIESLGGEVVGYAALASRGFCKMVGGLENSAPNAKLPSDKPFFALGEFGFAMFTPDECPLCKSGSKAVKPGSRGN